MDARTQQKERISEEMLDRILKDEDPAQLFHSSELWLELRRKLAERTPVADLAVLRCEPPRRTRIRLSTPRDSGNPDVLNESSVFGVELVRKAPKPTSRRDRTPLRVPERLRTAFLQLNPCRR